MEIQKYKELKTKIRDKSFEINFKKLDWGLYLLSFLGNAGAIFFAFFLLNPALQKTISQHLGDNMFFQILGILLTVVILIGVEYLKRSVFKIFSDEFIQSSYNLVKPAVLTLFMFSMLIFGASFYFSISGGILFSKVSGAKNEVIASSNKSHIDSLTAISVKEKSDISLEINDLRESNKNLRERRDNTPIEQRAARRDFDKLITSNEESINNKQLELDKVDERLKSKLAEIKSAETKQFAENEESDFSSILLFLIISTCSEVLIIAGIYFRELYDHKSFYENENTLEPILKKRERYEHLMKIVYKNGEIKPDDVVISLKRLGELVKNKGTQYSPKVVSDFYSEMSHLGAFKVIGNKRYALVTYLEAKNLIESLQG
jgi:hypothetical protein